MSPTAAFPRTAHPAPRSHPGGPRPTPRRPRRLPGLGVAVLALWLGVADGLAAQAALNDEDFMFSMDLPPGMVQLSDELRAANLGVPVAQVANRPRGESKTVSLNHDYVWLDPPGDNARRRQVELNLMDELRLEWRGEDHFVQWLESGGVTVTRRESIPRPLRGMIVEGNFTNSEGILLNLITLFIPRVRGYAIVRYQCTAESFPEVEPEFRASIDSIKFRFPLEPSPSTPNPHLQVSDIVRPESQAAAWGKLQVWGSFLLAGVILGALVMGGRSRPEHPTPAAKGS